MRLPQLGQRAALHRVNEIRGDVGHRLEHEGVLQLRARDAQVARPFHHQVAVINHVDVQRAVTEARAAAVAAMRVFQRVQPLIQLRQGQLGLQQHGVVEEIRAVEAYRRGAVGR